MFRHFVALINNNLRLEFRLRETPLALVAVTLLLTAIIAFGIGGAFIDPVTKLKIFPTLLWVVIVFSTTVAIGRSFEYEVEHSALDAVLMRDVDPVLIFLAKCISNFVIILFCHLLALAGLLSLLGIPELHRIPDLLITSIPALSAFTLLSTLMSGLTVRAKLRQLLLPIIMLPLLFPLFSAAVEITTSCMGLTSFDRSTQWYYLLGGLNLLYLLFGIFLFRHVVRE